MTYRAILRANLIEHEGWKDRPYRCPAGKLTIGVGHNLDDRGLSDAAIDFILAEDVAEAEAGAKRLYPKFVDMNENRQAALVELVFNLGEAKLREFVRANAAINSENWELAAQELKDSLWYKQVGLRAVKVVSMIRGA